MRDLKKDFPSRILLTDKTRLVPELLTDTTRLEEIYQLRVLAWEHTSYSRYINRRLFPNGWTDHLDNGGVHFIMQNEKKEIVASSRFNVLYKLSDLPEQDLFNKFNYPETRPFGLFSRLVIHPDYRKLGLSSKFDLKMMEYCKKQKISFTLAWIHHGGLEQLTSIGFKILGTAYYNAFSKESLHELYVMLFDNSEILKTNKLKDH